MQITIIGLGVIGSATMQDMINTIKNKKLDWKISGVDINKDRIKQLKEQYKDEECIGYFDTQIKKSDVYIISVYTSDQVSQVLKQIPKRAKTKPLVAIESTVSPDFIKNYLKVYQRLFDIVVFPHRFNPNDPDHAVFNLTRAMGTDDDAVYKRAVDFYKTFMNPDLIVKTTMFYAALSKVVENSYRYIEISIAEDWKMECDRIGIDFSELRRVANSKWNIDLKMAMNGIGGSCLPKDVELLSNYFSKSKLLKSARNADKTYKSYCKKKK
jgi:UDP-N-acetyl-D-mannosaminuronic acid dehydrogenase